MDIFNNREISIAVWSVIVLVFFLSKGAGRIGIVDVIKSALAKPLPVIYFLTTLYTSLGIYILYKFNLWEISELKDSFIWLFFSGFISLFKASKATDEKGFFRKAVKENIQFTVLIEFVVGLYVFGLLTELILIPLVTLVALMQAVAKSKPELAKVDKVLGVMLSIFGLGLIGYSIYEAVLHFREFASLDTMRNLILSPFLAIWFLPFIYALSLYMKYEVYFISLGNAIKVPGLLRYAQWQGLIRFNFDTKGFERWRSRLFNGSVTSKAEILNGIKEIKRLQKVEKHPPSVDEVLGWSPYQAKDFLKHKGIETRYYTNTYEDEWSASSDYFKLGEGFMVNHISYYIEGNERIVNKLHLTVNISQLDQELEAKIAFLEFAEELYKVAFRQELPEPIKDAIIRSKKQKLDTPQADLSIRREDWTKDDCYSLIFDIHFKACI